MLLTDKDLVSEQKDEIQTRIFKRMGSSQPPEVSRDAGFLWQRRPKQHADWVFPGPTLTLHGSQLHRGFPFNANNQSDGRLQAANDEVGWFQRASKIIAFYDVTKPLVSNRNETYYPVFRGFSSRGTSLWELKPARERQQRIFRVGPS